jgi:hypothetical protein
MAELHESDLAEWFGGMKSRGSGNQSNSPMDGRQDHLNGIAWAWDGKSTRSKSIGVSLEMWEKAREQAHAERPMLALRFYGDDRLRDVLADLVTLDADDFRELLDLLGKLGRAKEIVRQVRDGEVTYSDRYGDDAVGILARELHEVLS